eukprot:265671_1
MGQCFGVNIVVLYTRLSALTRLTQATTYHLWLNGTNSATRHFSCADAGVTPSDVCIFHCTVQDGSVPVDFNCDSSSQCIVLCSEQKCMQEGNVTATDAGSLSVKGDIGGKECFKLAKAYLPNSGNATFIMNEEKAFKGMEIHAGTNTLDINIDCTFGTGDECKGMKVYAGTARSLEMVVGASSKLEGEKDTIPGIIICPRNSTFIEGACVIDLSGGGLFKFYDITTINGIPADVQIITGSVEMTGINIYCNAGVSANNKNIFETTSPCWNDPTMSPTRSPTINPTSQTTFPTSDTSAPSTQTSAPTTSPVIGTLAPSQDTSSPSKSPSNVPTDDTIAPSTDTAAPTTSSPSISPTNVPTGNTNAPSTSNPTAVTFVPTTSPLSDAPTRTPSTTLAPSTHPVVLPWTSDAQSDENLATQGEDNSAIYIGVGVGVFVLLLLMVVLFLVKRKRINEKDTSSHSLDDHMSDNVVFGANDNPVYRSKSAVSKNDVQNNANTRQRPATYAAPAAPVVDTLSAIVQQHKIKEQKSGSVDAQNQYQHDRAQTLPGNEANNANVNAYNAAPQSYTANYNANLANNTHTTFNTYKAGYNAYPMDGDMRYTGDTNADDYGEMNAAQVEMGAPQMDPHANATFAAMVQQQQQQQEYEDDEYEEDEDEDGDEEEENSETDSYDICTPLPDGGRR